MRRPDIGLVIVLSSWMVTSVFGLGEPVQVDADKLTDDQQKIVDFALVQLQGGESCQQRQIRVENFSQQLVSGLRYKFDLILTNTCHGEGERKCSMDVYSVPWQQKMEVLWDNVKCDTGDEVTTKPSRIHLSAPLIRDLPGARVGIVDLSDNKEFAAEAPADDNDLPHVKKALLGGDGHDQVSHDQPLLGAGDHGPVFSDQYTVKELKTQKQSWAELKKLQSLGAFHDFMTVFNKSYSDRREYKHRYGVFKENMKKVQFLRESEQGTGEYGATMFADLTETEYKQWLGTPVWQRKRTVTDDDDDDDVHWPPADIPDVELPKEFDWREKGAVTEVKNQGQCGSCWAFSVTGNVEGAYAVKHGKLLDLSEQELVDCDKRDNGCGGGLPENAYKTLIEIGGLETEADYGYDGEDEKCKFDRSRVAARVTGGVEIGTNETDMAKWLLKNGPISVGLNANAMQFYKGGVSHPFKFLCDPSGVDHGVLIVGFGEHEYPLFKKKMPYWIIKNSWGTGWGEQGYYRLFRGDGTCGINTLTSSSTVE